MPTPPFELKLKLIELPKMVKGLAFKEIERAEVNNPLEL